MESKVGFGPFRAGPKMKFQVRCGEFGSTVELLIHIVSALGLIPTSIQPPRLQAVWRVTCRTNVVLNNWLVERGGGEERGALLTDESLSLVFRGFIEVWARKIASVEQRENRPSSPDCGRLEGTRGSRQDLA
jgi:hypothetical protein